MNNIKVGFSQASWEEALLETGKRVKSPSKKRSVHQLYFAVLYPQNKHASEPSDLGGKASALSPSRPPISPVLWERAGAPPPVLWDKSRSPPCPVLWERAGTPLSPLCSGTRADLPPHHPVLWDKSRCPPPLCSGTESCSGLRQGGPGCPSPVGPPGGEMRQGPREGLQHVEQQLGDLSQQKRGSPQKHSFG